MGKIKSTAGAFPTAGKSEPRGFYELARAHVAAHGGEWFVADRHKTPQQWRAWIAYFAWLDDQTTPRGKKAAAFGTLEKLTVPTEWPVGFDASAPPAPLATTPSPPISPERRKQLADMLRAIVAEHELKEQRAPTWRNMTAPQAEDRLERLAADYARSPPTVSTQVMEKYLDGMREEPVEFDETA
jgi:hypothetical protein